MGAFFAGALRAGPAFAVGLLAGAVVVGAFAGALPPGPVAAGGLADAAALALGAFFAGAFFAAALVVGAFTAAGAFDPDRAVPACFCVAMRTRYAPLRRPALSTAVR
jgi:hypothetical protein